MVKHIVAAAVAVFLAAPALAGVVYQQDFESSAAGFAGGSVQNSQGYAGYGFGNQLWHTGSAHGGVRSATATLSFNLAQAVRGATLSFSLAIIDSWDTNDTWGIDRFRVLLDSQAAPLFDHAFGSEGVTGVPGLGTLASSQPLGFTNLYNDSAYTLSLNLGDLAAGTHSLQFQAYGPNWQAEIDESFGVDNVVVAGNPVPEPGSFGLAGLGLAVLGLARRRRTSPPGTLAARNATRRIFQAYMCRFNFLDKRSNLTSDNQITLVEA